MRAACATSVVVARARTSQRAPPAPAARARARVTQRLDAAQTAARAADALHAARGRGFALAGHCVRASLLAAAPHAPHAPPDACTAAARRAGALGTSCSAASRALPVPPARRSVASQRRSTARIFRRRFLLVPTSAALLPPPPRDDDDNHHHHARSHTPRPRPAPLFEPAPSPLASLARRAATGALAAALAATFALAPLPPGAHAFLPSAPPPSAPPVGVVTPLTPEEERTVALFRNSVQSVVFVTNLRTQADPFTLDALAVPQGTGSGFVWDDKGACAALLHAVCACDDV